jgi:lipopolysaccharide export system permease protein
MKINTFSRYVLNRAAIPFFMGIVLILMVLSLERILRLVEAVTEEKAGFSVLVKLMLFLQPHYLGLAVPAALFFGTLVAFRKLNDNSELVVMRAAGISLWRMLIPVVSMAVFLSLMMFLIVDMAQPFGRYAYRSTLQNMLVQGQVLRLSPGYFESFGDDTVLRADAVSKDGRYLKGFFAWTVDDMGEETIITSRLAQVDDTENEEDSGSLSVLLTDGKIMTRKPDQKASLLTVQNYKWSLPVKKLKAYGPRGNDEREMTLFELKSGGVKNIIKDDVNVDDGEERVEVTIDAAMAEYHKRWVQIASLPFLVLLAVPLALIGQGRTGKATGLILGLVLLVLYEKTLSFGEAFVAKDVLSPLLGLWVPFYVMALGSMIGILKASEIFTPFFRRRRVKS